MTEDEEMDAELQDIPTLPWRSHGTPLSVLVLALHCAKAVKEESDRLSRILNCIGARSYPKSFHGGAGLDYGCFTSFLP